MSNLTKDDLEYIAYTDSYGDATPPLSFDEFVKHKNGTGVESNGPRKTLTKLDQEYIAYTDTVGDSTPKSYEEWLQETYGPKAAPTPRKKLSKEDQEYIAYTDSVGDATPLSFNEWKEAGKPSA